MKLFVHRLSPDAVMPRYAHADDSGMDVCSTVDCTIAPGAWEKIPLGLAFALPPETEMQVRPRSGLALRAGLSIVNTPATIDEGYRGEVCVLLLNHGTEPFHVEKGMRIAQIVICPVLHPQLEEVPSLPATTRGAGGFGSTGV